MTNATRRVLVVAFAMGLIGTAAPADIITTDPTLPPTSTITGQSPFYFGVNQVVYVVPGPPPFTVILQKILHSNFINITRTDQGPNEIEQFDSTVTGEASVGGGPFTPFTLTGPVSIEVFGKVGNVTGTFNTEMLSMDLSGTFLGNPVMIRESPTLASTGQTTITDIGGGQFQISSFFDVFTELSIDNGQTWIPSTGDPHHVVLSVPEPGSFVLVGMGAIGLAGYRLRRRLRRA